MSKFSVLLEKAAPRRAAPRAPDPLEPVARHSNYSTLIRTLFHRPSVVAVVGFARQTVRTVCEEISGELAAAGKCVVVIDVETLLRVDPASLPDDTVCVPGRTPNVWHWPATEIEPLESRASAPDGGSWLDTLRSRFDAVLLDCPCLDTAPHTAELAALADKAILVVEAGRTTKQQIQHDQRAFELQGVDLAGCVLVRRR